MDRGLSSFRCACQGALVTDRTEHPDSGVTPVIVVPLDPIVNRGNEFRLGSVDMPVVVLMLCDTTSRM